MNLKIKECLDKEIKKALKEKEVPVSAVITDEFDNIIASAHNKREKKQNSLYHAEILAIDKACKKLKTWRLENCKIYVTLEPCVMCTGAIIQSRITEVIFFSLDRRNGSILSNNQLLNANYTHKVNYNYLKDDYYSKLLSDFFKKIRNK